MTAPHVSCETVTLLRQHRKSVLRARSATLPFRGMVITKETILNTIDIYEKFYDVNLERIDPEILLNENNLNKNSEIICTNE